MRAAFTMWRNTRMIILTAICAAIYGAALIAFKTAIPLIPGFTEVRVGNIFPMPLGLMFGPAGAWGSAIGNLIGDLFGGTFGPGSVGGFFGNFLLGYLPYTLWTTLVPFGARSREWDPSSGRAWVSYVLIGFVSSAACAVVISAFVHALGMVPYAVLSKLILLNNTLGAWIGVVLLTTVFSVTKEQLNLFWPDIMDEADVGRPAAGALGAWLVALASMAGLLAGVIPDLPVGLFGSVATVAILVGCLLL